MKTHDKPDFDYLAEITGYSPKYIRDFYKIYVDTTYSQLPFSREENELIYRLVRDLRDPFTGRINWTKMEVYFDNPKRSNFQLKQQYHCLKSKERTIIKYSINLENQIKEFNF